LTVGTHSRQARGGRGGLDGTLLLAAGAPGFGFERGLVHAVHIAWSGNTRLAAERTPTAEGFIQAGELLAPGEMVLAPGQAYSTPWAVGSWGDGLNQLAARFHQDFRTRHHFDRPRPVTLNTWEAVYFDHNLTRLKALADRAARVGVERFCLDDGWFSGRRDDTAGLGDWTVDPSVWPDGLAPLVDHVRALGMEFGLWFEPEMVNPASDLARAHPDWILGARREPPPQGRHQQVLDLANPQAYAHVATAIHTLVDRYGIGYIKWDHNRDLVQAYAAGRPRVHDQVEALYRLLAELKARHPGLEIETCASGGGRVDLGILQLTDRIWTSDCTDPLERATIQKFTGLLVPPEIMGTHITAPVVHTTHRTVSLDFSAAVALFGHFGIEWDLTAADDTTLAHVADWVALYKGYRQLIATGALVHGDVPDPAVDVRGVVAGPHKPADYAEAGRHPRVRALFTVTQVATSVFQPMGRVRLPGLEPDRPYALRAVTQARGRDWQQPVEWSRNATVLTGRQLGTVGIRPPVQFPGSALLIELSDPPSTPKEGMQAP
jgi:alpha-galactosidase